MHILEKHATHAFFAASRSGSCLGRRVQESGSNLERDLYSHYGLCTEIRRKDGSMEGVAEVCLGCLWHFLWPCCIDSPTRFSICIEHEIGLGRGGVNRS